VPTQPPIDGLPLWAQLLISLVIGVATLAVAFKGYFIKDKPNVTAENSQSASILAASISDMGAMRHLSDVCIRLSGCVDNLTKAIEENTHFGRIGIDLDREMCARLRELKEELERQGKEARAWDKRDEARRP
jgi:hypothetical protein